MKKKLFAGFMLCIIMMFGMSLSVWAKAPGTVKIIEQKSNRTDKTYKVYWDKIAGVSGYEINLYNTKKTKLLSRKISGDKTSQTLTGIRPNTFYIMKIRAYVRTTDKDTGIRKNQYGKYTTLYISQQPKVTFRWAGRTSAQAKWGAVTGATGYTVYLSTKQNSGYKKVAAVRDNQSVIKKLKPGVKYYVYVTANCKVKDTLYRSPRTYAYSFRIQSK